MARKSKLKALLQNYTSKVKENELLAQKEARRKQLAGGKNPKQKLGKHAPEPSPTWIPFSENDNVVLVGEGDFSFAASCLDENYVNALCATSLDSKAQVEEKYVDGKTHLEHLSGDDRALVLHEVDGTSLTSSKQLAKFLGTPLPENGRIVFVFNFPHLGNSVADQDRNIRQHQQLMGDFFAQVRSVAPTAACAVTVFEGEPYASWDIKPLARSKGWKIERSGRFAWEKFPGYSHKLTAKEGHTNKQQKERNARTYLFVPHVINN